MMMFCADISSLDIECSILDIHSRWGAGFERKPHGLDCCSIRGVPRGHKGIKCEPDVAKSVVDPARAWPDAWPEGEVGRSGPDRRCCMRAHAGATMAQRRPRRSRA